MSSRLLELALLALALVACSHDAPDAGCDVFCTDAEIVDPFGDTSLALRSAALFDQTCSGGPERGCHSELAANLSTTMLRSNPAYSTYGMVDVPSSELPDVLRVEPFHPESSYVYWKVSGDPRVLDGSLVMPAEDAVTSGAVDPRIVALVAEWIEAGAP